MRKFDTILIAVSILLLSCEKVIDVDLNEVDPRLVVEASLWQGVGNAEVKLTQSGSYFSPNTYSGVSNAFVRISDDQGNEYAFTETSTAGTYTNNTIVGVPGRTYNLAVIAGDKSINATSTMPVDTASIKQIYAIPNTFAGSFGGQNDKDDSTFFVVVQYDEFEGTENYYLLNVFINGEQAEGLFIRDDKYAVENSDFFSLFQISPEPRDTTIYHLQSITKETHLYYSGLDVSGFGSAAAVGNPTSNLVGDALGYFSAFTLDVDTLVLP